MRKFLIAFLAMCPIFVYGQNDIQLTQQFLSRINYNPAATGASNYMNAYLIGRQQWIGFNGAPSLQVLNAHNYFEDINSGIGLNVTNDKVGHTSSINAKVSYAYFVHFENKSYLSFGLGAGILHKSIDVTKLTPEALNDPTLATYLDQYKKINPDFDFGVEFNTQKFQIGASVTHLNVSAIDISNVQSGRHMYLYSKYSFDLDRNWKLVPNLVAHVSSFPISQLEFNSIAYYKNRFWFGLAGRTSDEFIMESVSGIAGLFITDFLRLGYSYDYNLGPLRPHSLGSHEIMLSVRLGKGDGGSSLKTPRFFE